MQVLFALEDSLGKHVAVGLVGRVHGLLVGVREDARSLVLVQAEASGESHPLTGLNHLLEGEVVLSSEEGLLIGDGGGTDVLVEQLEAVFHSEVDVAAGLSDLRHGHEAHVEVLDGGHGLACEISAEGSVVEHVALGPLVCPHFFGVPAVACVHDF